MTDTRYIVSVVIDSCNFGYEDLFSNQTANEAAEFLIEWYASPDYDPEHTSLYLYLDDGSIDVYNDFSYEKYSNKELDIEYHIAAHTTTQLVFKFLDGDELVDQSTYYSGLQAQIGRRNAVLDFHPGLEYARIRYRLEPEWKTVN